MSEELRKQSEANTLLSDIDDRLGALIDRLTPVLIKAPPIKDADSLVASTPLNSRLIAIKETLSSLLERIDI